MSAGAQNQADPPADTIELIDGSVISGQLLGGSSAQIVFESDAAGKLSIPSGKVVAIESHQPVVLKLSDDRVIRAPSVKLSQGQFVVMTSQRRAELRTGRYRQDQPRTLDARPRLPLDR